jgi:hypothetical protein
LLDELGGVLFEKPEIEDTQLEKLSRLSRVVASNARPGIKYADESKLSETII